MLARVPWGEIGDLLILPSLIPRILAATTAPRINAAPGAGRNQRSRVKNVIGVVVVVGK